MQDNDPFSSLEHFYSGTVPYSFSSPPGRAACSSNFGIVIIFSVGTRSNVRFSLTSPEVEDTSSLTMFSGLSPNNFSSTYINGPVQETLVTINSAMLCGVTLPSKKFSTVPVGKTSSQ